MNAAYNDDYHVIHGILGKLYAVERQEREDHESLNTVVDALTSSQRQLESMCEPPALIDQMWIHVAKQRLPKKTLDSWEQHRNRDKTAGLPTSDSFRDFLESKARGRREFEKPDTARPKPSASGGKAQKDPSIRFRPYETSRERDKSYSNQRNQSSGSSRTTECVVPACQQSHPAWKCSLFGGLPLSERRELMRKHRLCGICLGSGHFSFACTRREMECGKCPNAPFKHHKKLCPKMATEGKPEQPTGKREPETPKL